MEFLQLKRMKLKVEYKFLQMKLEFKLEWENSRRKEDCVERWQLSISNLLLQKIVDIGQLPNALYAEYIRLVSIKSKCINTTSIKNNRKHATAIAQPASFIETGSFHDVCKIFYQTFNEQKILFK